MKSETQFNVVFCCRKGDTSAYIDSTDPVLAAEKAWLLYPPTDLGPVVLIRVREFIDEASFLSNYMVSEGASPEELAAAQAAAHKAWDDALTVFQGPDLLHLKSRVRDLEGEVRTFRITRISTLPIEAIRSLGVEDAKKQLQGVLGKDDDVFILTDEDGNEHRYTGKELGAKEWGGSSAALGKFSRPSAQLGSKLVPRK